MTRYIAYFIFTLSIFIQGCGQSKTNTVSSVRISSTMPVPDRDTNITITLVYDVYYWNNLNCYRIPVKFDSSRNGVSLINEMRNMYFVFDSDSLFGINFDLTDRRIGVKIQRLNVDSIKNIYNRVLDDSNFIMDNGPDSSFTTAKGEFVHVYKLKKTKRYPEDLTYFYYYSKKFKGIAESFSKKFDQFKGMKMFKLVIDAHGAWYESEKFQMPARQYIWQMDDIPPDEIDMAAKYFHEYLKLQKK